jgi:hypothetical protein
VVFNGPNPGGDDVAAVAEEVEQQVTEVGVSDHSALRAARRLPAGRIVFVPFSLVEVELLPDDE